MGIEDLLEEGLRAKLKTGKKQENYNLIILAKERYEIDKYATSMGALKNWLDKENVGYKSIMHTGLIKAELTGTQVYSFARANRKYIHHIARNIEPKEQDSE